MKCPHCGSDRITEKANFCGSCGKKLKTVCNCWIKRAATTAAKIAAQATSCLSRKQRLLRKLTAELTIDELDIAMDKVKKKAHITD